MTKISALPALTGDAGPTDLIPVVQGGVTYKATVDQVVATEDSSELDVFAGPLAADDKIVVRDKSDTTDHAEGTDKESEVSTLGLRHCNDAATTDPGVGDDSADGYSVGSRWTNVTLDKTFFCQDASAGAAVWVQIAAAGAAEAWTHIFKQADESVVSDTTLSDDAELKFTGVAGKTYRVITKLFYKVAATAMEGKFAFAFSGTLSGDFCGWRAHTVSGGTTFGGAMLTALGTVTTIFPTTAAIGYYSSEHIITVSANGTFAIQWAQNTSNAGAFTVLKGSQMSYAAIA